ncbi:MAG: lipid II flippase MurJ [Limnohabitans sp.]|jgi:peptidoglycan biosynthesis protein MviN/MurJ (putative lipid II flippase)
MSNFQKRFGLLFILSAAGYLLSFGNQLVVSYHLGTSALLDTYWALFALANLLVFYVQPLREALVPPVYSAAAVDRESASALFSAGLAAQAMLALASMALLLLTPAGLIARVGLDVAGESSLWLGFLPYFLLYAIAETCNGLLMSFNRVVYQAVARLASALIGLTCLWLLVGRIGVFALVLSLLIAQIVTLLVSIVGLQREGMRWVWRGIDALWKESRFRSVFSALLFAYLLAQVYVVCERTIMLGMMPGLVASYQYSVALVNVLISLLAFPMANLLWPRFLAQAQQGDADAMLQTAARVVAPLTLALLACCSFAGRFASEIVEALFARGSFDATSVAQTSQALRATVFAAIPISLVTILGKILLTQGRGRALTMVGASIALSGVAMVLLAGELGSVALVQWHWTIGNTVGLFVVLFMLLRGTAQPFRYVRAAGAWLWRACAVILLALWVTPPVAGSGTFWGALAGLAVALTVFGTSAAVMASVVGILDIRQILGRTR